MGAGPSLDQRHDPRPRRTADRLPRAASASRCDSGTRSRSAIASSRSADTREAGADRLDGVGDAPGPAASPQRGRASRERSGVRRRRRHGRARGGRAGERGGHRGVLELHRAGIARTRRRPARALASTRERRGAFDVGKRSRRDDPERRRHRLGRRHGLLARRQHRRLAHLPARRRRAGADQRGPLGGPGADRSRRAHGGRRRRPIGAATSSRGRSAPAARETRITGCSLRSSATGSWCARTA